MESILEKLCDDSVSNVGKLEIVTCIKFIMETFLGEFNTYKYETLEKLLEAADRSNGKLLQNILQTIGLIGVCNESTLIRLICGLNSTDDSIVQTSIEALAYFGITSRVALKNKMEEFHILNRGELASVKTRFIHPLDVNIY